MRRFLFCIPVLLIASVSASALDSDCAADASRVLYREAGYRGSISLTNQFFVWTGLDTSHGYMFGPHHYLGAGAGLFAAPVSGFPVFAHLYAEYRSYFLKKNSTPMAGVTAGYCMPLKELSGNAFQGAAEFAPHIGWNWAFNRKTGLTLALGSSVFLYPDGSQFSFIVKAMPRLSLTLEFR